MADNIPSGSEYRTGRSDSTSSTSSAGGSASHSPPLRRSSNVLFETLTAQKRKDDPVSVARRQSLNEQRPRTGFLGQMWDNWVRGIK
ncbi:hypothetical protein VTK56DRAFT_4587 [Thermocarpiscus australiensis]